MRPSKSYVASKKMQVWPVQNGRGVQGVWGCGEPGRGRTGGGQGKLVGEVSVQ